VLAALENADESAGSPGDAPAASYTVRQGDTLSLIAKKYYGNGRKYLALMEANRTTLAHPDKIYPAWWCASRRWAEDADTRAWAKSGPCGTGATTSATATIPAEFGAHDQRLPFDRLRTDALPRYASLFRANVIWITDRRRRYDYHAARRWGGCRSFVWGAQSRTGVGRTPVAGSELADARGFRRR
ncbi:MAG: LysM peptidoglycan-binding domain-containing protein, partial [Bacteroidota bacterium]